MNNSISLSPLTAISPIEGRYFSITQPLVLYFSEQALMRYRLRVEVEYFIALCHHPLPELAHFPKEKLPSLRRLYKKWDSEAAHRVKMIEKTTNHDVKALEYYIKEEFEKLALHDYKEFIHFGLTSQDINNTAFPLLLREYLEKEFIPHINRLLAALTTQVEQWKGVAMLARTHGQPASPTRLGKEMDVFLVRIKKQLAALKKIPHCAKFGGAVGNFNAHHAAYPSINWVEFGNHFVSKYLRLTRSHPTTQIEHYDNMAALFDNLRRINTILIDYSRDMWQYIAMNYFKQRTAMRETGSSTMPHKVNPIDFENAEGNLGLANALLTHLSNKLPISRLQRDLTDSTVMRNVGTPLAHIKIAFASLEKGMAKLTLNPTVLNKDLDENWAVIAEGIQTLLRRENYPAPYEALKKLTKGNRQITKKDIHTFIHTLNIKKATKKKLLAITPFNYTGI